MRNKPRIVGVVVLLGMLSCSTPLSGDPKPVGPDEPKPTGTKAEASAASPPGAGDKAPMFTLTTLDKKAQVDLRAFAGKQPVLLFFGSYT